MRLTAAQRRMLEKLARELAYAYYLPDNRLLVRLCDIYGFTGNEWHATLTSLYRAGLVKSFCSPHVAFDLFCITDAGRASLAADTNDTKASE